MGGGGKSAPDAPDFMALAKEMGLQSQQYTREQLYGNRPDIYTPNGSVTWNRPYNPATGGAGPQNSPSEQGNNQAGGAPGAGVATDSGGANYSLGQSNPFASNDGPTSPLASMGSSEIYIAPNRRPPPSSDPKTTSPPSSPDTMLPFNPPPATDTPWSTDPPATAPPSARAPGEYDPSQWAMNVNLDPDLARANEYQQDITLGRSQMGLDLLGQARQDIQKNNYWDSLPGYSNGAAVRQNAENALYNRATSRLDPMWQENENRTRTRLANSGLGSPTSEANQNAWDTFGRSKNDAYNAAIDSSIIGGGQEGARQQQMDLQARNQGITEGNQRQYQGMNALNAFMGGQQVGMPQTPGFSQGGLAQGGNLLGAEAQKYGADMNQYGANQAGVQGAMSGFAQLLPLLFML